MPRRTICCTNRYPRHASGTMVFCIITAASTGITSFLKLWSGFSMEFHTGVSFVLWREWFSHCIYVWRQARWWCQFIPVTWYAWHAYFRPVCYFLYQITLIRVFPMQLLLFSPIHCGMDFQTATTCVIIHQAWSLTVELSFYIHWRRSFYYL